MTDSPGQSAPTVLVVEDDQQVRVFLRELLSNEGYRIVEASTGAEGLKVAEETGQIDLLLADMLLPELSGFDLAEQLLERRPGMKILFVTGYVEGDIVQRSLNELGASFLDKPFHPNVLLQRVRDAVGAAKAGV
jgi:two-component system cell cycle sensor histidine kinase/response regulator CckA